MIISNIGFQSNVFISGCPSGWVDAKAEGLGCLYFHTSQGMSWKNARQFCADTHDSYLVEIYNSSQQAYLKNVLGMVSHYMLKITIFWSESSNFFVK